MNMNEWNVTNTFAGIELTGAPSWLVNLQQQLMRRQRHRQVRRAARSSYAIWAQRYGSRSQSWLDEETLYIQVLPRVLVNIRSLAEPSTTDVVTALASELHGCADGRCSSFAQFPPELADYVFLFEEALHRGMTEAQGSMGMVQAVS